MKSFVAFFVLFFIGIIASFSLGDALPVRFKPQTPQTTPVITPVTYPFYLQCDPKWGTQLMGGNATICQQGCAMSCVSMALAGKGISLWGNTTADPCKFYL
jgi:hypothetical protein